MSAKAVALIKEVRTLRGQIKQLKAEVERQQEEICQLQIKRDTLRFMLNNPITPEEIEELERWGKETMAAWERGDKFYTFEEMLEEADKVVKKQSWKKKARSRSSSRKRSFSTLRR